MEVYVILKCATLCLKKGHIRRKRLAIASDSQVPIQALGSDILKSKLVLECLEVLKALAKITKLTIVWIPRHERLVRNENADALAKKGAEAKFIGPEPFCGYNRSNFWERLLIWENKGKEDTEYKPSWLQWGKPDFQSNLI